MSSSTKQYDAAYHDAMKRIQGQVSDQTEMAMQVLAWITCAKRPLTTVELQSALAVEMNESDLDEDNLPDLNDMVSVCAGLVTIDAQSNVIRLVHYTTQEFFQRNQSTWFPNAHYDISSICVAYLSFDIFHTGHCQTTEDFISRRDNYPFGDYAAAFWGDHIRECKANGKKSISEEATIAFLLDRPKLNSSVQFIFSFYSGDPDPEFGAVNIEFGGRYYPLSSSQIATGLHIATYFELLDVMQELFSLGGSVDCLDAAQRTPLSWAAQLNCPDAIKLLLENGADPNTKDRVELTPLSLAARGGHEQAVQLLLEGNADMLSINHQGQFPLHASVFGGSEKITRLFLEQGISAHPKDNRGRTPLFQAVRSGRLDLVQLLFDWDLGVDCQDIDLQVLITLAVDNGREAIVQFLLDRGADPNQCENLDVTPLMIASMSNQVSVLQVLLKWGVELERKWQGQTALSYAAACPNTEEVIQLLLEAGADVNTEDDDGQSVFYHAASDGRYTNLTALFTSTKIRNIHQPNRHGHTPLHVAAMHGHLRSVSILLKSDGVQLEARSHAGRTALNDAAACRNTEVMQLLLESGADVNAEDNYGRNAIFRAASADRYANLTALFASTKIRNIHQPDRYGRTPLHAAATGGHLQSVLTLLQSDGVGCEAEDELGRTALSDAILRKRFDVVEVLKTFSETSSLLSVPSVVEITSENEVQSPCAICMVDLYCEDYYHCAICNKGSFSMCGVCYDIGARCLDRSHEMQLLDD